MRRVVLAGVLAALTCTSLAPAGGPAAAADGTWPDTVPSASSFVTVVGDPGDFVTGGADHLFRPGDGGEIHVFYNLSHEVEVDVADPGANDYDAADPTGNQFDLTFAAPPGEALTPGTYEDAQRTPFRDEGHPGIDVNGNGNGCNEVGGRFTVLDAPADLSRLWIVYHSSCGGPEDSGVSGEIKYNEPDDGSALVVAPDQIQWRKTYPDVAGRRTPVTLINTGTVPVNVGPASITSGAEDFSVDQHGCRTVVPGGTCALLVTFVPTGAGPRTGTLSVLDESSGQTRTVQLAGSGEAGHRSFDVHSQPGEKVGLGRDYSYWPGNAGIHAHGNRSQFEASVFGDNGDTWNADAFAPRGETFTAGSSYALAPANSDLPGATFAADLRPRGCSVNSGRLTIDQIEYDTGGTITALAFTFEQHCKDVPPGLAGSFAWHAPQPASPVPQMADPPPPPEPDPIPTPTDVTIAPQRLSVPYGASTQVTGRVLDHDHRTPVPHAVVHIRALPVYAGSFSTVATVSTDADGYYRATVRPGRRTQYQAAYDGAGLHLRGRSATREIEVAQTVAVAVRRVGRHRHHQFRVTSRVAPVAVWHTVYLQRRVGTTWSPVAKRTLTSLSSTTFRVGPLRRSSTYRVVVPYTRGYLGGSSRGFRMG